MSETLLDGRVVLHPGDCRAVLATLAPDGIDAVVTDPPYHLGEVPHVKRGGYGGVRDDERRAARAGFMGKAWDGGDVAFDPATWAAVLRVLKPGGHLLAMGGTRTYHRLACAIEDAGFEIRDTISWLYGSGFPKSHDVSKGIDKAAGVEFVARPANGVGFMGPDRPGGYNRTVNQLTRAGEMTDAARQWEGWGTALKPACELIVLARKPLSEGTVAANVLRWGTGAINVDGCRVVGSETISTHSRGVTTAFAKRPGEKSAEDGGRITPQNRDEFVGNERNGRWPANVAHDGSDEVVAAFPETASGLYKAGSTPKGERSVYGQDAAAGYVTERDTYGDAGNASRFFYTAKADADDRLGSKHPTVKPLDLMQWLVRLVTPKGGTVLDPFAGTGTTGEAAWREGMRAVLIEAEAEYQADIRRRMALVLAGPDERARESVKAKGLPRDDGPLFAGEAAWREMWAKPFDFSQEPT